MVIGATIASVFLVLIMAGTTYLMYRNRRKYQYSPVENCIFKHVGIVVSNTAQKTPDFKTQSFSSGRRQGYTATSTTVE